MEYFGTFSNTLNAVLINVIDYLHVIVSSTLYDEPLKVVMVGEGGQLQQPRHGQGLVHLGYLPHHNYYELLYMDAERLRSRHPPLKGTVSRAFDPPL